MPTNKIALRSVEMYMADYTPIYAPIYPLFLNGKAVQHSAEVGKVENRRVTAVGDIRARRLTPKDTVIAQVAAMDSKKTFKKYFFANQYTLSEIQDREGAEEVVTQVLDEHHVQADELLMTGEGTTPGTQVNNGLFLSSDANYVLETSYEIPSGSTRLHSFFAKIMETVTKANTVPGKKVLFLYGNIKPLYRSLFATSDKVFATVLREALGADWSVVEIPDEATPSSSNGWIAANLDQTKLHYSVLPALLAQGNNEEKMYLWFNFLLGSMMLEVLASKGVIRQPTTLAS